MCSGTPSRVGAICCRSCASSRTGSFATSSTPSLGWPRSPASLRRPSQIVSDVVVPAPISGVITDRSANPGQVVGMGEALFVVTDLSEVWVVGDLYEQDFQAVRVGSEAALTMPAYPDLTLRARVTYIAPRVDP
ncbi:MAG TPA: efflux RND transporter periplasmic adaptor subunit [Alphaproteobacteria bacterium]|nr:efflux RND transporter periplasmic adaptor subunit [Alphaproteobacteria bacterium]